MSKMDGLRAMREARYAEAAARAKPTAKSTAKPTAGTTGPGAASPAADKAAAETAAPRKAAATVDDASPVVGEVLCGHRNMSGRTCTREHGHAAKSHRYS